MSEIKPVKMYLVSAFLFFAIGFGAYFSVRGYINYFLKSDIISFSFPLGFIIFGCPLLAWASYWMIIIGYRKQKGKLKKR
ncbi:hypothetical protein [Morganella morganii]|uniref:hypothetical protein n=1 Tax=Morganella morganii TaxID=582 RepID=UPI001F05816C|nr:hypothetical protein [Morganella morganii]